MMYRKLPIKLAFCRYTAAIFITAVLMLQLFANIAYSQTIRLHHFMSPQSTLHQGLLEPFVNRLQQRSNNQLNIQLFHSMSLGGSPSGLYDQAVDGAVDIILTLPGYTPGRFLGSEVYELPFFMENAEVTSASFWDLVESDLQQAEFRQTKILAAWVHGPGVIHSKQAMTSLEDMKGLEIRGPTQLTTQYMAALGASPVGMPLPSIAENISRGTISATLLPWEITPTIRLAELVNHHTEFASAQSLYTATFVLAMNLDTYESIPPHLRTIFDDEIGKSLSLKAIQTMLAGDRVGRLKAAQLGNTIHTIDEQQVARWQKAAEPVYEEWIEKVNDKGLDGQSLINQAQQFIEDNQQLHSLQ